MYFIDNNFFNSKYNNISTKLKYYCIKERENREWKKYYKEKTFKKK